MKPKKAGSVRRLLPYMKGYWKECILGPIFKLLEAIFELIVPLVTAKMIDVGSHQSGYRIHLENGGACSCWRRADWYSL